MRARILLLSFAVLAALVAGCGNHRVLLGVDALSFTQPAQRDYAFGPVPPLPSPIATGEVPLIDNLEVNLVGGAGKLVQVDAVTLTFGATAIDSTGSGLDTLRVYMSDGTTDPRTTPAVMTIPIALTPGTSVPIHTVVDGDARVMTLFTQDKVRVTVTTAFSGPASGSSLNGRLTITQLRADVVARKGSL